MRSLLTLVVFAVAVALPARAAQTPDPVLLDGLRTFEANGIEAGLRTWFIDRPGIAAEMREKMMNATKHLGPIIDTELVAIQPVSKRVTRYYVAIYFERCPLWIRVERYANHERAFYLPLTFSTDPDAILPGYVTEFRVP